MSENRSPVIARCTTGVKATDGAFGALGETVADSGAPLEGVANATDVFGE